MYSMMTAYNLFSKGKRKERFEIILEPLQAMIQISFLAFYPVGSKLNIHNNLLYIQTNNWTQPISRTYYNDSKDDLFYLFNAVIRFNKFYKDMPEINNDSLFKLLRRLSIKGIDNLILTYNQVDNPALLHTLKMYKLFLDIDNQNINSIDANNGNNDNQFSEINDLNKLMTTMNSSLANDSKDIDDVFINIIKLYTIHDYNIIYNTLSLLEKNPQNYLDYVSGLNNILSPINIQIKKWINDNIVF